MDQKSNSRTRTRSSRSARSDSPSLTSQPATTTSVPGRKRRRSNQALITEVSAITNESSNTDSDASVALADSGNENGKKATIISITLPKKIKKEDSKEKDDNEKETENETLQNGDGNQYANINVKQEPPTSAPVMPTDPIESMDKSISSTTKETSEEVNEESAGAEKNTKGLEQVEGSGDHENHTAIFEEKEKQRAEAFDVLKTLEKDFKEIKSRLFDEQLVGIQKELKSLENDTHPEYSKEIGEKKKNLENRLSKIEYLYKFRKTHVLDHYHFGMKHAEDEFDAAKLEARRNRLQRAYYVLNRIENEDRGNQSRMFINDAFYEKRNGTIRYKFSPFQSIVNQLEIVTNLESEEIDEDMNYITQAVPIPKQSKPVPPLTPIVRSPITPSEPLVRSPTITPLIKMASASSPQRVTVRPKEPTTPAPESVKPRPDDVYQAADKSLHCKGKVFRTGDYITVEDKFSSTYSAVITAINHCEVWLRRINGSRTKMYYTQIKAGKYKIIDS